MSVESIHNDDAEQADITFKRHLRRWFYHRAIRALTLLHMVAMMVAGWIGRRPHRPAPGQGHEIMLTGRFDSDGWILALLRPLTESNECSRVWMVSTNPIPHLPKAEGIYPPRWLGRIVGKTPARLLTFICAAIRHRPHIVGGFHLLLNGMVTATVGRLVGARSMYFCVGGPVELLDGGVWSGEGSAFAKMETPDSVVERRLLQTVSACDMVITMGTSARDFFCSRASKTSVHVVPGGINAQEHRPGSSQQDIDVISIGRIVSVKRFDVLLEAVRQVARQLPTVRVAVVGEGPLRKSLMDRARALCVDRYVRFVGYQRDINDWLGRSRTFVLTSDSEGLSLAMMEAMMCGLPAIVSDVGDLSDLVEDGVNGYLVPRRSPAVFSARLVELLKDEKKLAAFSRAAHYAALRHETRKITQRWDKILLRQQPRRLGRADA